MVTSTSVKASVSRACEVWEVAVWGGGRGEERALACRALRRESVRISISMMKLNRRWLLRLDF